MPWYSAFVFGVRKGRKHHVFQAHGVGVYYMHGLTYNINDCYFSPDGAFQLRGIVDSLIAHSIE
jgi:hypothetical protein